MIYGGDLTVLVCSAHDSTHAWAYNIEEYYYRYMHVHHWFRGLMALHEFCLHMFSRELLLNHVDKFNISKKILWTVFLL